ncbi:MAG: tetratricopeptide repeat protein [Sphingomicrobium sp.]
MNGDQARSAELLYGLSAIVPGETELAKKAMSSAVDAGRFDLALALARRIPAAQLASDARLLVVAEEIKRKRFANAAAWLVANADGSDPSFLKPMILAWATADSGDANGAIAQLAAIPVNSPLAAFRSELSAYVLLEARRTADAEPFARRAIGSAGPRETQVRLALASGFLEAGNRPLAAVMLDGISAEGLFAKERLLSGKLPSRTNDTLPEIYSEIIAGLASDLARLQRGSAPLGLAQVARFANPANTGASVLTALMLDLRGRTDAALAVLRSVPLDDPLIGQVRDTQVRLLTDEDKTAEALAISTAAVRAPGATFADWSRLGDAFSALNRQREAADAYTRALAGAGGSDNRSVQLWTLYLLQASALKQAGDWPAAKAALERAVAIAPDEPLLLNFLGYAKLEKGEDMDAAEAMIRKANRLSPDDASIIDSLGWALFKRGKTDEAITTLLSAAEKDPNQSEIQEHLGDALFTNGRRYEARFAWRSGLLTADDLIGKRLQAKIDGGLTSANAAP